MIVNDRDDQVYLVLSPGDWQSFSWNLASAALGPSLSARSGWAHPVLFQT